MSTLEIVSLVAIGFIVGRLILEWFITKFLCDVSTIYKFGDSVEPPPAFGTSTGYPRLPSTAKEAQKPD